MTTKNKKWTWAGHNTKPNKATTKVTAITFVIMAGIRANREPGRDEIIREGGERWKVSCSELIMVDDDDDGSVR